MQTERDSSSGGSGSAGASGEGTDKKVSGSDDSDKREQILKDVNELLDELMDGKGDKVLLLAFMNGEGQTKGMIWNSGEMLDLQMVGNLLKKLFSQETFEDDDEGGLN